jgi:hypothetical protein
MRSTEDKWEDEWKVVQRKATDVHGATTLRIREEQVCGSEPVCLTVLKVKKG